MNKKVLVLFTCFNRKEKTVNCIETLTKNEGIDFHFIVVDDNSNDGTYEWLKSRNDVEAYSGDGGLFYSGGMRLAMKEAKKKDLSEYDFVMLVNDDVFFFENSINKLIEFSNNNQEVVIGATSDKNGKLTYSGVKKSHRFRPDYSVVMSTENNRAYCDTFCANCVLIPRTIFEKIPDMDSAYCHAMGDYDYGFSITRAGYKIVASDFFVGICETNSVDGSWRDTALSIRKRLKLKESPKGLPYKEWFYYLKKNYSFASAIAFSITPYIKIVFKR